MPESLGEMPVPADKCLTVSGRHFLPFVVDGIAAEMIAQAVPPSSETSETAGQDTYQDKQFQRLPEVDGLKPENAGNKRVPQQHNGDGEPGYYGQPPKQMAENVQFSIHNFLFLFALKIVTYF
jgi:hypothetical protein